MTDQTNDPAEDVANDEELRELVRERVEDMPAETALGNRDPQGGGKGDPKDVEPEGNDQF
jgi:hypothetical protein